MKRSQFLASLLGVVAAPFVAKEVKASPKILTDDTPFKNYGMMIPGEKIGPHGVEKFILMHDGKEYCYFIPCMTKLIDLKETLN